MTSAMTNSRVGTLANTRSVTTPSGPTSLIELVVSRCQGKTPTRQQVAAILAAAVPAGDGRVDEVMAAVVGAGALEEFVQKPGVTDVLVAAGQVWLDRGNGLECVAECPTDPRQLALDLAARAGRRLDDAVPIVDARLPSGVRLHVVLPPISADGVLINLRVPATGGLTLTELGAKGMFDASIGHLLHAVVRSRRTLLISGATGTGKTTLLAAMLACADVSERIVCVEEAQELDIKHPHVVHLQSREANVEGSGAITLTDLVRASLRMRPDRLVVGECRGAEVRDVLLALNTGHAGSAATVHANTVADVPSRLAGLALLAGIGREAAADLAASAFDVVIHLQRTVNGRVVDSIGVLAEGGVQTAYQREGGRYLAGPGAAALACNRESGLWREQK